MKEIRVKVSKKTGEMTIETSGFAGIGCKSAIKSLTDLGTVINQEDKAELHSEEGLNRNSR